jgi:uncharacterized protein
VVPPPARPFPDSYRQLNEFAERYAVGAMVYARDSVPAHCYVLLNGRVVLEGGDGDVVRVLGEVAPGQMFGHVAAFDGRPVSTSARVTEDAVIIVIPLDRAVEVFRVAPELAIELLRDLARRAPNDPQSELPPPLMSLMPEVEEPEPPLADLGEPPEEPSGRSGRRESPAASGGGAWTGNVVELKAEFDESFFFLDTLSCPVCETNFEYLRVRTASVRPKERESDFRVTYSSEDPTRYVMTVCPTCSYASTHDDFHNLNDEEREAISEGRQQRGRFDYPNLGGPRTIEDALLTLELGQMCYERRRPNERRQAVILQRRAWFERERGDETAEREWLTKSRDAYVRSFELDSKISDEAAMRVAYLIGDLCLRLDDPIEAAQWLETATRFPQAKEHSGLERMARDRLSDARKAAGVSKGEQQSA